MQRPFFVLPGRRLRCVVIHEHLTCLPVRRFPESELPSECATTPCRNLGGILQVRRSRGAQHSIASSLSNLLLGGGHLAPFDFEDLNREDEAVAATDLGRAATVAISEVRGDVELPLVALNHELHRLRPPFDDLVGRKSRRSAAGVTAIEGGPRGVRGSRAALVVALTGRIGCWVAVARALAKNLVLQTGRQLDDAFLVLIALEECDASSVGA
mmetsp:Transcript_62885/g.124211  ORF Transcript_62885/g.124211 Transcript_62885/m.124211 type:complete len:213 (-) Transcript_62885:78-716(-)